MMAFDRSARTIDADGRLHLDATHISKANVCPYYGQEIPGWESLGLQPDRVYRMYRDPVELERGAGTFARLPILSKHVPVTVDAPQPDLVIGAIGSNVRFDGQYLDADLSFWDSSAIAGIESGKWRELSCAYRYTPVMEAGEVNGEAYDGRMTEIRGNHLALVEVGRAGSDVYVADAAPINRHRETTMKMTRLGKALYTSLAAISAKLAADASLPALLGSLTKDTTKKDELKPKLVAMDADMNAEQVDNIIDAILDVEQNPEPQQPGTSTDPVPDESPAGKVRALLAGKVDDAVIDECVNLMTPTAADANEDYDDMKMQTAMDAAIKTAQDSERTKMQAAARAARDVRPVVGDVDLFDAGEIYGFALDHMKVEHKGITDPVALQALFNTARSAQTPAPRVPVAQDSATAEKRFPGLARIRSA
jgi:hypothetical protein